ncbi:hypothetical protein, partial [Marisediminicola sp. UYEF4]|uniref:hypothetical protein n=1 Tax=Marisediminicola sp. UYEF4 TaxID=1756384 RepID=UPI003394E294
MRKAIIVTLYYCVAAGAVSYLFIYGFGPNLGTFALIALGATLALTVRWMLRQKAVVFSPVCRWAGRRLLLHRHLSSPPPVDKYLSPSAISPFESIFEVGELWHGTAPEHAPRDRRHGRRARGVRGGV